MDFTGGWKLLEDDFALVRCALFARERKGNFFFAIERMSVKKLRIEAAILRIDPVEGGIG